MSQRGDRGEGHGARRPGRSSSFGGHRGGGVGGAAKGAGGPSGGQPPLSSNRSFRKAGNGYGGHQRVVNQPDTTGFQPAPAPGPLQTPPRPPAPQNAPVHVPVAAAPRPQHHADSPAVQAPPPVSPTSDNPAYIPLPKNIPRAAPRAPSSKTSNAPSPQGPPKGESSKGFNLQFGSINMNANGLPQFPARTSSAPPNLDEQKRNQVLPEGLKVAPSMPIPPALKQPHLPPQQQHPPPQQQHPPPQKQQPSQLQQQQQPPQHPPPQQQPHPPPQQQQPLQQQQQTKKDALGPSQPNAVNTHVPSQAKRDLHVSPSAPNVAPPRPTVQPIPGMPMSSLHYHHQQPQVPLQFGGHNQSVVPSSMQMSMGLPGGNASQVQQHMYVQNMQQHQMHQQMLHQGQTMMFPSVGGHQLPPQLGNASLNMAPQYPQQHQNKPVGPRKSAIKIIDPHTGSEVKLGRSSSNVGPQPPQPQQVSGYATQPMVYYPPSQQTSYNQSGMYYPGTTGSQVPTGSQARFYPTTQAGQSIPFANPSIPNIASASHKDNIASPAASVQPQITGKPHVGLHMEKPVAQVKISIPPGKSDAPKLKVAEHVMPHQQKDISGTIGSNKPVSEKESKAPSVTEKHSEDSKAPAVTEQHPTMVTQPLPIQATKLETDAVTFSVTNSPSILSGVDGKNKEAIQRTDSLKDNKKNVTRKDAKNLQQQPQSASSSEELKGQTSVKVADDGVGHMEAKSFITSKELDLTSTASGLTAATSESSVSPVLGTSEANNTAVNAADVPVADISSIKSSSVISGEPQAVESLVVGAAESRESEINQQISPEVSDDKILSDSTGNESHECTLDMAEQASLVIPKPGNADAASCVTDPRELPKEPAPSILEEHSLVNRSQKDTQTSSAFVDGNDVSEDSSVTSSESTIRSANDKDNISIQETAASSITAGMLPENHSVASQDEGIHTDGLKYQASADQSSAAPTGSARPLSREKPTAELTRTKSAAGKKKKRKEMLSKADAAGTSDLYNAYKGPEEQLEGTTTAEGADRSSIVDGTHVLPEESERDGNMCEDDGKKKVEPDDDWEDAADISTPKLQSAGAGDQASAGQVSDSDANEANGRKKYSRDFLLTFAHQYSGLPVGIRMDTATSALFKDLVGKSYVIDRDPHPNPGNRPTSRGDRRGVPMDDDKWTTKSGVPFSPGRDAHMDLTNGPATSYRGGPSGGNHGVSRNQRGVLLVGPMQSIAPQVNRSGSDSDRWEQRGLIPSPVTPMQIMHKAEKKYVVGKVSDEEQAKQRQLKSILNKLTPQNFDKLFEQVKEVNIDNVSTLNGVISQIFDKALMEPTFCEMYANFCSHLAGALPDFSEDNEKITFKRLLLNKCQEEFERGEREEAEAEKTEEEGEVKQTKEEREEKRVKARRRMLGNIRLIGELYKKRMLTERIMHECIKKLIGDYEKPDEENIEALCKLMSTIGEMIDHPKAKEHMDAYFDRMRYLSTSQLISSRVRFLLRDSIDLRRNRWQQRRKVDGPKKIDEVHKDAAQEKHAQSSRLARGPVINSAPRRGGPPMDYGSRGSVAPLASPGPQQRGRGFGNQDIRFEQERHQFDNRTVPLPQRSVKDEAITLGPQGGLARGMSLRGQPPVSNAEPPSALDHRRMVTSPNGYNAVATAREDTSSRIPDRVSGRIAPATQSAGSSQRPASQDGPSVKKSYSEEDLREKSIATIREYYSAKDEKEVALCIEELNAPSFYPSVVSLWVNDSFERKNVERELLAKLFVGLFNGGYNLFLKHQLIEGLSSVLSSLEDALSDSPKASEYLGLLLARFVLENILLLQDVGRLIEEGGEEPGHLVREGIAADVLGAVLEFIKKEKGDSFLNEAMTGSNLKLEDFRPQHLKRSKLDAFMQT